MTLKVHFSNLNLDYLLTFKPPTIHKSTLNQITSYDVKLVAPTAHFKSAPNSTQSFFSTFQLIVLVLQENNEHISPVFPNYDDDNPGLSRWHYVEELLKSECLSYMCQVVRNKLNFALCLLGVSRQCLLTGQP